MIEILEYLRSICKLSCDYAYNDVIPTDVTNAVAIRILNRGRIDRLDGNNVYNSALIQVFYRGTSDRLVSLTIAEAMSKNLNILDNVILDNTVIIQCHALASTFAFIDDNQNVNYSITLNLDYQEL